MLCTLLCLRMLLAKRGRETSRSKAAPPPLLQGQCHMTMACTANALHMAPRGSHGVAVFLCPDLFGTIALFIYCSFIPAV